VKYIISRMTYDNVPDRHYGKRLVITEYVNYGLFPDRDSAIKAADQLGWYPNPEWQRPGTVFTDVGPVIDTFINYLPIPTIPENISQELAIEGHKE